MKIVNWISIAAIAASFLFLGEQLWVIYLDTEQTQRDLELLLETIFFFLIWMLPGVVSLLFITFCLLQRKRPRYFSTSLMLFSAMWVVY
jgi:hypothetical protein